jgi:hypothetical protein
LLLLVSINSLVTLDDENKSRIIEYRDQKMGKTHQIVCPGSFLIGHIEAPDAEQAIEEAIRQLELQTPSNRSGWQRSPSKRSSGLDSAFAICSIRRMDQNFRIVQVEANHDDLVATAGNFRLARGVRYRCVAVAERCDRAAAGHAGGAQER